ncbi:hypothetical protein M427DRAFT_405360 [Gonapodya prolifera JEL478]|uniref:Zn(2)-C6 fungal-type domain-containing protein n=1 Tax=Gonapodya prolifera (strain JEL478) TaxID=1344416 RepID=A0A139AU38_GONPJ|nr:hypothetical protein M427DRAFT_405360 [Gonapodya prolifera JEL478]|eukprot:KXS20241.1 hypothetical protein M427DRAFT_405360 [Gonapodya prolifera JEL478]
MFGGTSTGERSRGGIEHRIMDDRESIDTEEAGKRKAEVIDGLPVRFISAHGRHTEKVSKACMTCRRAKTKCDARQPRCTYCETRDLVCDYQWVQKPRGPPPDPLSERSGRKEVELPRVVRMGVCDRDA